MLESKEFLEHVQFNGNIYGTSKSQIMQKDKTTLFDIEEKGFRQFKEFDIEGIFVLLTVKDFKIIEERLKGRKSEDPTVQKQRIELSIKSAKSLEDFPTDLRIFTDNKTPQQILDEFLEYLKNLK